MSDCEFTEGILNDIRDIDDKEENEKDKLEWVENSLTHLNGCLFFSIIITLVIKKLTEFVTPSIRVWHRDWFTDNNYVVENTRTDEEQYEDFKKLYRNLKKEQNWNDCECSECHPTPTP